MTQSQPAKTIDSNLNLTQEQGSYVSSQWLADFNAGLNETQIQAYRGVFSVGYCADYSPQQALQDIAMLEQLKSSGDNKALQMRIYSNDNDTGDTLRLRLMRADKQVALSDVLPLLENFGLRILGEQPYQLNTANSQSFWLHVFEVTFAQPQYRDNALKSAALFEAAFAQVWQGNAESDLFNQLVLSGQLDWRAVTMLRAYCRYMKQIKLPYTRPYIANALAKYPEITADLVNLFKLRLEPSAGISMDQRALESRVVEELLLERLQSVDNLTDDQIFRQYLTLIKATLRSNFYQCDSAGNEPKYLAFKFDINAIPETPKPRPMYEIFVYSADFEGVHLRGGKVARGGLRWSDREEDFRTEVLGLVKAQQVKNSVIVPMGAKGGFVCKTAPSSTDREAWLANGVACYRQFISALLELTDNLVEAKVVAPQNTVRWDQDDPYLVVAADKGTATFSDIANEISQAHNFWLGDAFASGGSVGYDHKGMGITAKGAWVSVQRHFRELGIDVQKEDFSVVAVGDMAGDVFGNGMLCSEHICLLAAFNHQHIFVDPNPDSASSFVERQRLFNTPGSNWADYSAALISDGGGIFNRSAKSIVMNDAIKQRFGIEQNELTPDEFIHALLKAKVDLFWNGGIGTYAKSSNETHADVGDHANDHLRVNASDMGARVIGEGGNLGITQLARVEYCLHGGRCNTDFIDNAAGVDCSDHEVNIKILLNVLQAQGDLTQEARNELLYSMTDAVSELVLQNNYRQTQAISLAENEANLRAVEYRRLISHFEQQGRLDRELEFMPSDDAIAERKGSGKALTRPELSVMISYAKLALKSELAQSDVSADNYVAQQAHTAFPELLRTTSPEQIDQHRLHSELVSTQLAGDIVNRMGITFIHRMEQATGEPAKNIAKAYVAARDLFDIESYWQQIEALDYSIDSNTQYAMFAQLIRLVRRSTRWLLRERRAQLNPAADVASFKPTADYLVENVGQFLQGQQATDCQQSIQNYIDSGVPEALARFVASARYFYTTFSIAEVVNKTSQPIEQVSECYFGLGETLELNWFADQIVQMGVENYWQAMARESFRDDLESQQATLVEVIIAELDNSQTTEQALANWLQKYASYIARWQAMTAELRCTADFDLAMFPVAIRELLDLSQAGKKSA
jgi:glutamate dehydrogenase